MLKLTDHFVQRADIDHRHPEPYAGEQAVSYQPERDGPLFPINARRPETDAKIKQIRSQYRAGTEKLRHFLATHRPARTSTANRAFTTLANRVNDDEREGFYSTEITLLYGEGKYALDSLCVDIDDETIPLHKRVAEIDNLADGIEVCASGTLENLRHAAAELRLSAGDVRASARNAWENIARQVLREFADSRHRHEPNYAGNETHYVAGYQNMLADRYGLPVRTDHAISPGLARYLDECDRYLQHRLTPTRLVRSMAEACLAEIQAHYHEDRDRVLSENDVWRMRQAYGALEPQLRQRYGTIEPGMLFNEHVTDDEDDEARYTLIDNPTMLMHAIAKNLRDAGVFKPFKTKYVAGQRGAAHAIKQVGDDVFYVKTRERGDVRSRPVELGDLPPDERRPALVMAALANTRDSSVLAQFPPDRIWEAIDKCPTPADWLAELSSAAVRRYRDANPAHEAYLLDRAYDKLVRGSDDPRRHTAAVNALARDDGNLSIRLMQLSLHWRDAAGNNFLHYACRYGRADVIEAALQIMKDIDVPNQFGQTLLMVASVYGHRDVVRLIMARIGDQVNVNARSRSGTTPLMYAVQNGHTAVVEVLLDHGSDVNLANQRGETPLMAAAGHGRLDVARLIMARMGHHVNVNARNNAGATALMYAMRHGHAAIAEVLLDHGADVNLANQHSETPLMAAAWHGHLDAIRLMMVRMGHHVNVNAQDGAGRTPLMHAVHNGHTAVVEVLLDHGADINLANQHGETPLMAAAGHGRLDVARLIMARMGHHVNVNARNHRGTTALMYAARNGHTAIAEVLLDHGADVNLKDSQGVTALTAAAARDDVNMMKVLLAAGAYVVVPPGVDAGRWAEVERRIEAAASQMHTTP